MHTWFPPDEPEFEARRNRQKYLDGIEAEMDRLFLKHEQNIQRELGLETEVASYVPKLEEMDKGLQGKVDEAIKRREGVAKGLGEAKASLGKIEGQVNKMKEVKPVIIFSPETYLSAVDLFRNGKYKESVETFQKTLGQNPPRALMDNIHFGMGSALYKMKDYPQALQHMNLLVKEYPRGDKWYMGYIMLGLIHNVNGETSQALYALKQALGNNPPTDIYRMINDMIKAIQGAEVPDAAG